MDERVRVGVIGLGTWGENQALAYSDYHRCELAVVCDLDEDRAREVGGRITSPERHPIAQHLSPSSCPSTHANQDVSTLADAGGPREAAPVPARSLQRPFCEGGMLRLKRKTFFGS
jgi:hypothetical protein